MRISFIIAAIALFLGIALFVGIVWLQVFLSKKENKWLGLILPAICLIISIMPVLGIVTFQTFTTTGQVITENGEVIKSIVETSPKQPISEISSVIFAAIYIFILYNIPTAILLLIYFGSRQKLKRNKEIDKMNIQDLE